MMIDNDALQIIRHNSTRSPAWFTRAVEWVAGCRGHAAVSLDDVQTVLQFLKEVSDDAAQASPACVASDHPRNMDSRPVGIVPVDDRGRAERVDKPCPLRRSNFD